MSDGGTFFPLPVPLDSTQRRVRTLVYREMARAYAFPRPHDEGPACPDCGGDGCQACRFTGEPQ